MHPLKNWEVHYLVMIAMSRDSAFSEELVKALEGDAAVLGRLILSGRPEVVPLEGMQTVVDEATLRQAARKFLEMAESRRSEHKLRTEAHDNDDAPLGRAAAMM